MPKFNVSTIVGKPDGYHYEMGFTVSARSPKAAASAYARDPDSCLLDMVAHAKTCVRVIAQDAALSWSPYTFVIVRNDNNSARPFTIAETVTEQATRAMLGINMLLDTLECLSRADALSLMLTLESCTIDCEFSTIDENHPATASLPSQALDRLDVITAVREFLNRMHGIRMIDEPDDLAQRGGFSPYGDA